MFGCCSLLAGELDGAAESEMAGCPRPKESLAPSEPQAGEGERGGGDGDEMCPVHFTTSIAPAGAQLVRRVSPSCTTLTAKRPSLVKIVPCAIPRADDVDTDDWA